MDSLVIAGTGAGKTMPFIMPLLLDQDKIELILYPLQNVDAPFQDFSLSSVFLGLLNAQAGAITPTD